MVKELLKDLIEYERIFGKNIMVKCPLIKHVAKQALSEKDYEHLVRVIDGYRDNHTKNLKALRELEEFIQRLG